MEILETYPGLNLDEVALAISVQRTAAKHHLRALERMGEVHRLRWGRHTLHFPRSLPASDRILFCLFRVPSLLGVALELAAEPRLDRRALAAKLQVTPRTIRRALRLLERHGLVRIEPAREGPVATLHPRLRVLLARERPFVAAGQKDIP